MPPLPGALPPNPVPARRASQLHSPPHGTFSPAAPLQQALQQAQGAAGPAADSAPAEPGAPAADGHPPTWQQQQEQQEQKQLEHQQAAQAAGGGATAGAAARNLSRGHEPLLQHGARPLGSVAAKPGCAAGASVVARELTQANPQPHGPKLPVRSASGGAPARRAAGDPQGRWQRADRPAESGGDARTGRAAPDPAGVQQDGGASARSGSAAASTASGGAHPLGPAAGRSGEAGSEVAAAADEAAAEVLQRLQQAQDAERMAHREVSAAAIMTPTEEQAVYSSLRGCQQTAAEHLVRMHAGAAGCKARERQLARPISRCGGCGRHQAQAQARGRAALRAGCGARGQHGA